MIMDGGLHSNNRLAAYHPGDPPGRPYGVFMHNFGNRVLTNTNKEIGRIQRGYFAIANFI